MSKHTPGPWFYEFEAGRYMISCQGEFGPVKVLAITAGFYPKSEENARLIAQAPRLLGELVDLVALAESAMRQANRDGAEYDIEAELESARATIEATKGNDND